MKVYYSLTLFIRISSPYSVYNLPVYRTIEGFIFSCRLSSVLKTNEMLQCIQSGSIVVCTPSLQDVLIFSHCFISVSDG